MVEPKQVPLCKAAGWKGFRSNTFRSESDTVEGRKRKMHNP
jgi:hypothetical protein